MLWTGCNVECKKVFWQVDQPSHAKSTRAPPQISMDQPSEVQETHHRITPTVYLTTEGGSFFLPRTHTCGVETSAEQSKVNWKPLSWLHGVPPWAPFVDGNATFQHAFYFSLLADSGTLTLSHLPRDILSTITAHESTQLPRTVFSHWRGGSLRRADNASSRSKLLHAWRRKKAALNCPRALSMAGYAKKRRERTLRSHLLMSGIVFHQKRLLWPSMWPFRSSAHPPGLTIVSFAVAWVHGTRLNGTVCG